MVHVCLMLERNDVGGVPGLALLHLFVVYMAYSYYALHHHHHHYHHYHPSSPNPFPNLPLLSGTISGEMKDTQGGPGRTSAGSS